MLPGLTCARQAARRASPALRFVLMVGIMSFFADFTYEGSRSITGPYLGLLGASAFTVSVVSGAGEFIGYGWAFGVHEALNQFGALFGPLLVALVLAVGHHDYKVAFAVLAAPAAVMLSLLAVARLLYPRPQDLSPEPVRAAGQGLPRVFWLHVAWAALAAAGFADFPLIA